MEPSKLDTRPLTSLRIEYQKKIDPVGLNEQIYMGIKKRQKI